MISPVHENLNLVLPKKCVFAFLGEYIDEYAEKTGAQIVSYFISMTKEYPVYITTYKGEKIVLCQAPVGAAAATQILDWLIGYGVREIISAGSCGALEEFAEGTFLIPEKALRDEGTSYHYAAPSRFMEINKRARKSDRKDDTGTRDEISGSIYLVNRWIFIVKQKKRLRTGRQRDAP